ncbi:hypothetical protein GCM10009841_24120 [Microlunatus panaciterrae]|uniref:1-acyl-sn-glycerol-3-phosphate acyltransferase n=1 Tax=Microlunatus panaciterrae TaxID=400768 RepID=A0ABS2RE71_9ACTN|nr:lysophospholipid acyltransferase family protein [Microlunatus panaciterrae]MBM7797293.1 1-acyl-sn-glycerol-3-phosphate acyltransferase [Microlunatus panaciterrae]
MTPKLPIPRRRENRPAAAEPTDVSEASPGTARTDWARRGPVRVLREVVQVAGLRTLLRAEVSMEVQGLDRIRDLEGPALIVANHSSHLDTALLLCTLPADRRRRTAVAAAKDYFFDTWWRAAGSAIAFNTFPIDRQAGALSATPGKLLSEGWSVLLYPEGTRSKDGYLGRFRLGAAWLAAQHQVPVIPVGLRGSYAAMPRGKSWPVSGRPRVSVRYGDPIVPRPGETPRELAPKIAAAVKQLIEEDSGTWWQSQRGAAAVVVEPPAGSWRRIWQQTEPPAPGGGSERTKIWRN